jgi:U4/U6.U5 tri-snRNP component SNU23
VCNIYGLHFHPRYYFLHHAGKKPRKAPKEDLPKPTELMKRREASLELDKNLGKTMVVQNPGARGPGQPGFFCETCNRNYRDSTGYLDHINSKARMLT